MDFLMKKKTSLAKAFRKGAFFLKSARPSQLTQKTARSG